MSIICGKCNNLFRSHSNYEEAQTTETEDVTNAAGVQQVEDASGNENDEITTPPDDLVAHEIDNIENGPIASTSSSSSSSSLGPSRLHIQKPRAKKMTDTAKQRQELHKSFLSILQKDQGRDMKPDDEIDSTFFGYANRMRLHLNQDQKEDVLQEINKVVTEAINNVHAGLPVINRGAMFVPPLQQATPTPPPPMQQMGQQGAPPALQQMVNNAQPQPPPMQHIGNQQQPYEFTFQQL